MLRDAFMGRMTGQTVCAVEDEVYFKDKVEDPFDVLYNIDVQKFMECPGISVKAECYNFESFDHHFNLC